MPKKITLSKNPKIEENITCDCEKFKVLNYRVFPKKNQIVKNFKSLQGI
jgi:hypothetical protein